MSALFVVSAGLQYNDPDPIRWASVYGAAAVLSVWLTRSTRPALLALVLGLGCAAWALYLIHSVWGQVAIGDLTSKMHEKGGAVEVGREAGGLLIEAVWLLFAGAFRGAAHRAQR